MHIDVTGSWSVTIDASDLQSGAGSDLNPSYESASNAVTIDINGGKKDTWRVDVKRVDTKWHGNFHLYVRRTSNGGLSGGTSYKEVTDTDQGFFSGDFRKTVDIQLKLGGVSVQIPPATYITTVYYTVVQTN